MVVTSCVLWKYWNAAIKSASGSVHKKDQALIFHFSFKAMYNGWQFLI